MKISLIIIIGISIIPCSLDNTARKDSIATMAKLLHDDVKHLDNIADNTKKE